MPYQEKQVNVPILFGTAFALYQLNIALMLIVSIL